MCSTLSIYLPDHSSPKRNRLHSNQVLTWNATKNAGVFSIAYWFDVKPPASLSELTG